MLFQEFWGPIHQYHEYHEYHEIMARAGPHWSTALLDIIMEVQFVLPHEQAVKLRRYFCNTDIHLPFLQECDNNELETCWKSKSVALSFAGKVVNLATVIWILWNPCGLSCCAFLVRCKRGEIVLNKMEVKALFVWEKCLREARFSVSSLRAKFFISYFFWHFRAWGWMWGLQCKEGCSASEVEWSGWSYCMFRKLLGKTPSGLRR